MTRRKILVVTAVWGEWHIDALMNLNIPSLLSPSNLPYLAQHHDIEYRIHTRTSDLPRILGAQSFDRLQQVVDARVLATLPDAQGANIFAAHHQAWVDTYEEAVKDGYFVLNLPPDVVFADGAGTTLTRLIQQGKRSIIWMYMRVVEGSFVPAIHAQIPSVDGAMTIPPRDLVALMLQHLHPLQIAHFAESPYFGKHPEIVLWPVRNEGILMRVLASVNALYEPASFPLGKNYLMTGKLDFDAITLIDDSDDLCAVSLTPFGKDFEWHHYPRSADFARIGAWWLHYDSPANDFFAAHHVRYHLRDRAKLAWREREQRANMLLSAAATAREARRLFAAAWGFGCARTAALIAAAAETRALLRAFPRPLNAIVFGPSDRGLEGLALEERSDLFAPQQAPALSRFLRHHVATDPDPETDLSRQVDRAGGVLQLESLAGSPLAVVRYAGGRLSVNGIPILGAKPVDGRHQFVPIDGVLDQTFRRMP